MIAMSLVSGTPLGVVMPDAVWSVLLVSDLTLLRLPLACTLCVCLQFIFDVDKFSHARKAKTSGLIV